MSPGSQQATDGFWFNLESYRNFVRVRVLFDRVGHPGQNVGDFIGGGCLAPRRREVVPRLQALQHEVYNRGRGANQRRPRGGVRPNELIWILAIRQRHDTQADG